MRVEIDKRRHRGPHLHLEGLESVRLDRNHPVTTRCRRRGRHRRRSFGTCTLRSIGSTAFIRLRIVRSRHGHGLVPLVVAGLGGGTWGTFAARGTFANLAAALSRGRVLHLRGAIRGDLGVLGARLLLDPLLPLGVDARFLLLLWPFLRGPFDAHLLLLLNSTSLRRGRLGSLGRL